MNRTNSTHYNTFVMDKVYHILLIYVSALQGHLQEEITWCNNIRLELVLPLTLSSWSCTLPRKKGLLCLELTLFNEAQKFIQRLCNINVCNNGVWKTELDTSILGKSDKLVMYIPSWSYGKFTYVRVYSGAVRDGDMINVAGGTSTATYHTIR
jgi:hypothetical protein